MRAQVPAAYAPGYFGSAKTPAARHYSVPSTHTGCMWPEGELTCRVLGSGAKLQLLRVPTRLEKFTTW